MKKLIFFTCLFLSRSLFACPDHDDQAGHHSTKKVERPFVATTAKSFKTLMDESMVIMHEDMEKAGYTKDPTADFLRSMIPHHQGAIDMAQTILLYSQDKEVRNFAIGIITAQQNEVAAMKLMLEKRTKK